MTIDADVIVVGLGVGGEFVAGRLAEAGVGVVGIESALAGGECPYWGCVPSKMIIRAANTLAEAGRVGKLAGDAAVQPDWSIVARRIREEATDDWDDTVAVERFTGKGGRFVRGRAAVTGSRSVVVGGQEFRASRGLVLATGTQPAVPAVDGPAGTPYWTNREALEAQEAPASLTVVGGGAGARCARGRGPCPGPGRRAEPDDLRLPDVPPSHRRCHRPAVLTSAGSSHDPRCSAASQDRRARRELRRVLRGGSVVRVDFDPAGHPSGADGRCRRHRRAGGRSNSSTCRSVRSAGS